MMRIGPALIALLVSPRLVLADQGLSGEDAACIDWSVKNCETKGTDKEHLLVDQANAKDSAGPAQLSGHGFERGHHHAQ